MRIFAKYACVPAFNSFKYSTLSYNAPPDYTDAQHAQIHDGIPALTFPHTSTGHRKNHMTRAAVFIGVDKTGNLTKLKDAASGAKRMYAWALAQGMVAGTHAKLITDAGGLKVTPEQIYDAIKSILDGPGVDQLIVYFAGHGVNINRNEYWLLSDAPVRASAAVNLTGSAELARYSGISHIVFISDSCRVAPDGIQAQNVRGEDIFPNDAVTSKAKPVDLFFACGLGKTAAELKDPNQSASSYSALYTTAMHAALMGNCPQVLELGSEPADTGRYVRPRTLQSFLEIDIPRRILEASLAGAVNQDPDAIITSNAQWLSRIVVKNGDLSGDEAMPSSSSGESIPSSAPSDDGLASPDLPVEKPIVFDPNSETLPLPSRALTTTRGLTHALIADAVADREQAFQDNLNLAINSQLQRPRLLAEATKRIATPFGPDHLETTCGIKIRGIKVVNCYSSQANLDTGQQADLIWVAPANSRHANVLLEFEDASGAVIPAIKGFIAGLTFERAELVDVSYEPATNDARWLDYRSQSDEIRRLRAIAASSAQHSRFRLDGPGALEIALKMQYAKHIDPTLAIYAAYAYHDLGNTERIAEMSGYLHQDVNFTFFDLALLSRSLINESITPTQTILPSFPLLAQGWALLNAHRVRLPFELQSLDLTLKESLWTLFNQDGVTLLRDAIRNGIL